MTARPRVLIVDDNPDNRDYAHQILEESYEVEMAGSGSSALEMVGRRPDLILLDISLPRRDGFEILTCLRADPAMAGVPIVACTAHDLSAAAIGFDDWLPKPYRPRQLLGMVKRLVG